MDKKPTYEELEQKIRILENEILMLKRMEEYLFESTGQKTKHEANSQENRFISLDEQDIDFAIAEKNINMLQAYEYYLSESFPVSNILNNTIQEFPEVEPVLEVLISNLACTITEKWTKQEIIEHSINVLEQLMTKE